MESGQGHVRIHLSGCFQMNVLDDPHRIDPHQHGFLEMIALIGSDQLPMRIADFAFLLENSHPLIFGLGNFCNGDGLSRQCVSGLLKNVKANSQ